MEGFIPDSQRLMVVLRSLLVGSLATVFDLLCLATLIHGFDLDPRVASAPALVLGVAAQFAGNKLFAFRDTRPRWAKQGAQFLAVEALGFVINLALFHVAVSSLPVPALALRLVTTSLVYFAVCLPLWTRIFQVEGGDLP